MEAAQSPFFFRVLAVVGLALVVVGVVSLFSDSIGFAARGALKEAPPADVKSLARSFEIGLRGEGAVRLPPPPSFFTESRMEGKRSPVKTVRIEKSATDDLLEKKEISLEIDGKTIMGIRAMRVEEQFNGNTVAYGPLQNGRREAGDFVAVFDPNEELIYFQSVEPFDQERGVTTLIRGVRMGSTFVYYGQNTAIDLFNETNDTHRVPVYPEGTADTPFVELTAQGAGNDPVTVQILGLYTPNASAMLGGDAVAEAYVQGEVARTNLIFQLSGIQNENGFMRHELMGVVNSSAFNYNEGSDTISYITDNPDVAALRNQYGADLVAMFSSAAPYCGVAWLIRPWVEGSAAYGFSDNIVAPQCQGSAVYSHETGHNSGFHHDHLNAGGGGEAFPYSFGYQQSAVEPYFRTVMAYSCTSVSCPRVNRFSTPNPAYAYNGMLVGNPHDHDFPADNAQTGTLTLPYVANFRGPVSGDPPAVPTGLVASDAVLPNRVRLTWDASAGAIQYKVYRSESPTFSDPIHVASTASGFADDYAFDSTPITFGTTYYYAVKALNPYGESAYSNIDAGSISGELSGAAVRNLSASDSLYDDQIVLSWENADVGTNRVYRSTAPRFCTESDRVREFTRLPPGGMVYLTETTDGGIQADTIYYYSVGAVDTAGIEVCALDLEVGVAGILSPPEGLTATDGTIADRVRVEWQGSPLAEQYVVYGSLSPAMTAPFFVGTTEDPFFEDTTPNSNPGVTYYYAVKAYSLATGYTGFSNVDGGYVSFADGVITNFRATDGTYSDRVELTWDVEPGTSFYVVLRSTQDNPDVADHFAVVTTPAYTDALAGVNTTYHYWVRLGATVAAHDTGNVNSAGTTCIAGDLDLGNGTCRAYLLSPHPYGGATLVKTGSSWDQVVNAAQATTLFPGDHSITTRLENGVYTSSRTFLSYALQPYASRTITTARLRFFPYSYTQQLPAGDILQLIPATPANPLALTLDDYDQIPLQNPPVYASFDFGAMTYGDLFEIPLTPIGMTSLQNAAQSGAYFNTAFVFSQTYESFPGGSDAMNTIRLSTVAAYPYRVFLQVDYDA